MTRQISAQSEQRGCFMNAPSLLDSIPGSLVSTTAQSDGQGELRRLTKRTLPSTFSSDVGLSTCSSLVIYDRITELRDDLTHREAQHDDMCLCVA